MKLIDILVQELPKIGGWPEGADYIATNGYWRAFAYWVGSSLKGRSLNIATNAEGYVTREQYEAALAASKPEWNGEGLPPVGTECEMSYAGDEWHKCVIIARGEEQIIYQTQGCREFSGHRNNYRFRPIRSEADKKKEAVEKAIADALLKDGDFDYAEALRLSTFIYGAISRNEIPHIRIN